MTLSPVEIAFFGVLAGLAVGALLGFQTGRVSQAQAVNRSFERLAGVRRDAGTPAISSSGRDGALR
ncbi:MAG: hypothetical protein AAGH19_04685 [Pseudomonadota bacterium]